MAAPADYLDAVDLKNVLAGGLINEDLLNKIWDCSDIPMPFLDMIGESSHDNPYSEWAEDTLAAVNLANKTVSGSDMPAANTAATGARKGNHSQTSTKFFGVTDRADATDNTGRMGTETAYKTGRGLQELRRDVEGISLSNQASVADDNNTTPGQSGGLSAWIATNNSSGATGSPGGFNTGTKLVVAATPGTARALTYTLVRTQVQAIYTAGGNPTVIMSVPDVTKNLTDFLFTSGANVAKPTAIVSGTTPETQVIQHYADIIRSDFGTTLRIVPNRLLQSTAGPRADLFVLCPEYLAMSYLIPYRREPLAKLGLSNRTMLAVDWMLKVYLERAQAIVRDLTPTATVTA